MKKALDVPMATTERKPYPRLTVQEQAWEERAGWQIAAPAAFVEPCAAMEAAGHEVALRRGS